MVQEGGEILLHNIEYLHHIFHATILNSLFVEFIGGAVAVMVWKIIFKIKRYGDL